MYHYVLISTFVNIAVVSVTVVMGRISHPDTCDNDVGVAGVRCTCQAGAYIHCDNSCIQILKFILFEGCYTRYASFLYFFSRCDEQGKQVVVAVAAGAAPPWQRREVMRCRGGH